ncbi:MAG: PAS domain-containing protein [Verrucomicrobiales bacterium]
MTESPESRLRDPERLRVLRETRLIGGRPDESLDHLARLAASVLNVPSALVSLVDDEHQWFTNSVGLPPEMDGVNCTPLSTSFCKYCVIRGEVFAIDDATRAPDLPEANAVAELGVVAYLGAPLRLPDGKVLGALCAIDSVPRRWSESDRQALADLAAAAVPALEIRLREVEGARIRAEAQNSESQFQLFIESAASGIYGLDRDGICTFCNPRAVELLGYASQDELVGRRMHDLIHHTRGDGTAFPREDCGIFKALERNKVVHLESETLWKKNGSSFYADCWSSPVIQDGEVCGAVVSFYDVTQRVLADEMVRVEQEFLQHVIDNVPVFIGVCLTDGTFIRANQTALECGGQHGADVIGRLLWECPWWDGDADAQKRIREAISRAAQGEPVRFDCAMRLGGDERATFDFQIAPMRDAAGKITHLVPSGVDISERSQMEAALQRARLAADDASRAKSDFLANTSHEIRTPMAAILGYAEILGARLGDPDDLSCAENIMRNGEHLVELIDDILDLSKIEAGKIDIEKEAVSIPALIREVCSAMGVRAATKGINLTAVQRGPTPSEVDSDPKRLRQILVNLIGNAIKFTDRGEVRLTIEAVGEGAESAVRFEVADSGKGMTEDEVAQVFQPFHQGDHAEEGAGLGLAISRKLAAMLGGEIYCEHSAPGEGSIFHFDLALRSVLTLVETREEGNDAPPRSRQ